MSDVKAPTDTSDRGKNETGVSVSKAWGCEKERNQNNSQFTVDGIMTFGPLPTNCLEVDMPSCDIDTDLPKRFFQKMAKRQAKKSNKKIPKSDYRENGQEQILPLTPTEAQLRSWPLLLPRRFGDKVAARDSLDSNRNMICIAPTGSGKTLAYGIPLIAHCRNILLANTNNSSLNSSSPILGIVLLPTRELAIQVSSVLKKVAKIANRENTSKSKKKRDGSTDGVLSVVPIYGGADKGKQLLDIAGDKGEGSKNRGVILAATTGRLVDLMSSKRESDIGKVPMLNSIRFVVIDEADRMASSGEISLQVDEILTEIRKHKAGHRRLISLFSATLPDLVTAKLDDWVGASKAMVQVESLRVGGRRVASKPETDLDSKEKDASTRKRKNMSAPLNLSAIPSNITQIVHVCSVHKKPKKLLGTLGKIRDNESKNGRMRNLCIIFFSKIKTLKYTCMLLRKEGHKCLELHSSIGQSAREKTMNDFRCGKIPTLLATDIAARGVHFNNVKYVINYDFPGQLEQVRKVPFLFSFPPLPLHLHIFRSLDDNTFTFLPFQYIHRCGRSGRDKEEAFVYSFFIREMHAMANDLVSLLHSTGAWVDPNLRELVKDDDGNTDGEFSAKKKRRRSQKKKVIEADPGPSEEKDKGERNTEADSDDDWDDGQFANLDSNQIALKRATHVSDAEDSDSNGEQS